MSEKDKADEAIERAKRNALNHYDGILDAARYYLRSIPPGMHVVSGQLFKAAMRRYPNIRPQEKRVMGAVMRALDKEKLIIKAGISTRERSHGGMGREWKRTRYI